MTSRLLLSLLLLAGVGCASRKTGKPPPATMPPTGFWKPFLLYQKAVPHERLHVEVDAVAGCEPSRRELEALEKILSEHCDKPGGIEISRSDVISRWKARGLSRRELSRRWMDGPKAEGKAPAYLYVLFYDGRLGGETPAARANPHTELLPCPAAVFVNRAYRPFWSLWLRQELLQHEAGHLLGLAVRDDHAKAAHCTEKDCLMRAAIPVRLSRLLPGRDPVTDRRYCRRCLAQLKEAAKPPPAPNLLFVGPVLVREEKGYRVLSLPGAGALAIGGGREQASGRFFNSERNRKTEPGADADGSCFQGWIEDAELRNLPRLRASLDRASRDPQAFVREVAAGLRQKIPP